MLEEDRIGNPVPKPIRIQMLNLRGVLTEILTDALRNQTDITLVTRFDQNYTVQGAPVDILLLGSLETDTPPAICRDLWLVQPELKILVFTPNDMVNIYWLDMAVEHLALLTPDSLLKTIRNVSLRGFID